VALTECHNLSSQFALGGVATGAKLATLKRIFQQNLHMIASLISRPEDKIGIKIVTYKTWTRRTED
jgi:hypothetical protein